MRKGYRTAIVSVLLSLAGCSRDQFIIEMRPQGARFERLITCRRVDSNGKLEAFSEEKLKAVAEHYRERVTSTEPLEHVFRGTFEGRTPADIGGAGFYVHFTSQMGSLSSYTERFRGNDDLQSQVETFQRAADRLVDLLKGWFQAELGQTPGVDKLLEFCDASLRRDFKNLALYLWAGKLIEPHKKDAYEEIAARIGQYLVEKGCFASEQVPQVAKALWFDPSHEQAMALLRRQVARALGRPEAESSPELGFLDPKRAEASLEKYLRTTPGFAKRTEDWKERCKTDSKAPAPDPLAVLQDTLGDLTPLGLFEGLDRVDLRLACPDSPISTNGVWNGDKQQVEWSSGIQEDRTLPTFTYAVWSHPDSDFQKAHFGGVILSGKDLAQYVLWRQGLDAGQAKEWDAFLAALQPGPELRKKLESFAFSKERQATGQEQPAESPAKPAVELLLKGLEPKTEPK
jgi:hypothetical protein